MKLIKYLLFIFCLTNLSFGQSQNCHMLKDGKYSIEYDSMFKNYPRYKFEIKGNRYFTFKNELKKDFEIITITDCSFRINDNEILDELKLTDFQKIIVKQQPYYEIYRVEGNEYYFICRIDLHVQCYSGKFIRE